jgi:hypothetical protein
VLIVTAAVRNIPPGPLLTRKTDLEYQSKAALVRMSAWLAEVKAAVA